MKLWFKIFITSVFLVIAAVNITATVILSQNRSLVLERERNRAASDHEFVCTSIRNTIAYERLKSDAFMMTEDRIAALAAKTITGWQDEERSALLYDEAGECVGSEPLELSLSSLKNAAAEDGKLYTMIVDKNERSFIAVGSVLTLEGSPYTLISTQEITEIYLAGNRELLFSQIVSVVCAALISAVLLVVTKVFLKPLDQVRSTLSIIADGDYSKRMSVSGSEEFRSLAEDVNVMAASVEQHYQKLEALADERKQFIDSLSHEIKTPLTSILGFADLLRIKRDLTPEELTEYATIIVEEASRLRALSGKLMELVSTGSAPLSLRPVCLESLLTEVLAVFEPIVKAKRLHLYAELNPVTIHADGDLFKSLVYNLIDNAVKASHEGSTVSVTCIEQNKKAVITVTDQGKGISKSELQHVFEPFYMSDKARSRKQGGAGIGLALCAEIAKKHHAHIRLDSEPGKGTAAIVTVPSVEHPIVKDEDDVS